MPSKPGATHHYDTCQGRVYDPSIFPIARSSRALAPAKQGESAIVQTVKIETRRRCFKKYDSVVVFRRKTAPHARLEGSLKGLGGQ